MAFGKLDVNLNSVDEDSESSESIGMVVEEKREDILPNKRKCDFLDFGHEESVITKKLCLNEYHLQTNPFLQPIDLIPLTLDSYPTLAHAIQNLQESPQTRDGLIKFIHQILTNAHAPRTKSMRLQNNEILIDLIEFASRDTNSTSFQVVPYDPQCRTTNLLRYLLFWSIEHEHLELLLTLTYAPFVSELIKIESIIFNAIVTAIQHNKHFIAHYLHSNIELTACDNENLFWYVYKNANQAFLQYALLDVAMMELVGSSETDFGKFFELMRFSDKDCKIQHQFILALLEMDIIRNKSRFLQSYLINSSVSRLRWEIIEWFVNDPETNPDYSKPFPDNALSLAFAFEEATLLQKIVDQYGVVKKEWITELLNKEIISVDLLEKMLQLYYLPKAKDYDEGLIRPPRALFEYNYRVRMSMACLAQTLYLNENSEPERKAFDVLISKPGNADNLFFEMLNQKNYLASLKAIANYAHLLNPLDLKFDSLRENPQKDDIIKCLLNEPAIFKSLNTALWLEKIRVDGLDSYELRLEICKQDFYNDLLKITLLRLGNQFETVPTELWIYMALLLWQDNVRLIETSIGIFETLESNDADVTNGRMLKLHAHDNQLDLIYADKEKKQQCVSNIELKSVLNLGFFASTTRPFATTLHLPTKSRQQLVDIVEEKGGIIPDIRNKSKV